MFPGLEGQFGKMSFSAVVIINHGKNLFFWWIDKIHLCGSGSAFRSEGVDDRNLVLKYGKFYLVLMLLKRLKLKQT
jgi:hypothetical protein